MVEWKKLGEVCEIFAGGDLPNNFIKGDTPSKEYIYPIYSNGVEEKSLYGFSDSYKVDKASITISARGTIGYHCIRKPNFTPIVRLITLIPQSSGLLNLSYLNQVLYMTNINGTQGGIPQLTVPVVSKISIPIPSLSEQQRIVEQLDTFTSSIENLKQQIAQRRKQYEYYRDQLLDLEGKDGVEMKTLGEVLISLKTGLNPRNNFVLNSSESANYYITVRELGMFNIKPIDKTDKVSDEALKLINNRSNLEEGDVLFSGTGTIGRTALVKEKPKNWNIKEGVYSLKPRKDCVNSYFLVQLLHTNTIIDKISALVVGDPIRSIPMKSLVSMIIPVPSLQDQHRIVSILDTFESSIQNLEAQLEQRQKQYEYYRNKLLTFE